ncbi:MAG: beta-propeller domain-containing protein [Syntrophomonas sp.]|nr:beta-propeller domain-containing protein [Syntrophomonas sp.]
MKSPWGKYRAFIALVFIFFLMSGGVSYGLAKPDTTLPLPSPELPVIGTSENLLQLLAKFRENGLVNDYGTLRALEASPATNKQAANKVESLAGADTQYSQTNVQVKGVDEADLVKTDGKYIYQVNQAKVLIIEAVPADQMKVIAAIEFEDAEFKPIELYLADDNLIVVGSYSRSIPILYDDNQIQAKQRYMPNRFFQSTRGIVYDIKDKSHPVKVRELELEGSYLSSRLVYSSFYLLTNKHLEYYTIQEQPHLTPLWRDTVRGNGMLSEELGKIHYFPDCISPNYLTIAALDLKKPHEKADIHSYLGSGDQVYASLKNIYVAFDRYDYAEMPISNEKIRYRSPDSSTAIYKFSLEPGKVNYYGSGSVPGTILNQFSMDETGDYFRIATTTGEVWRSDQNTSRNNVYILDKDLKTCGKLEDIAPGEKIYSTRFMGDRAYMVTFKKVDPFFVLDMKDPNNPKILGKLKIPGYSDYLHPYDENHIIGFGKDTVQAYTWNGESQAFYQGMKVAVFDVTDVTNPVEMSRVFIGDRGTDSELLRNHKALLFSREKNLLAFPVKVMEIQNNDAGKQNGIPEYGSFAFQGLYIYNIDLINGLQFRGKITHLSVDDYLKSGNNWFDREKIIERTLYIGDTLYTMSPDMIKAHDIWGLWEIDSLPLR